MNHPGLIRRAVHALAGIIVAACASVAPGGGSACDLQSPRPLMFSIDQATAPLYDRLARGESANIMIVGDSISYRVNSYNWFLRDHLHAAFGSAGEGYFAIGDGFTGPVNGKGPRPGQAMREADLSPDADPFQSNSTGHVRWAGANGARPLPWGAWTPDGIYAHLDGPGAIELDVYGRSATLHYLRMPAGGRFRVICNGVDLGVRSASVPMPGSQLGSAADRRFASPGAGSAVIRQTPVTTEQFEASVRHDSFSFETGAPDNDTLNTVRIEWVGGGLVQLNGIEMRSGAPGVSYTRIARGGQGPREFLNSANKVTAAQLLETRPDLLIVMLDWSTYEERQTFEADTHALLDFYQHAMPGTPVILMTHHPFISDMALEADIYRQIACERGCGYINLFDLFTGWQQMASLGFMFDSVHLTPTGGAWFGGYVFGALTSPLP